MDTVRVPALRSEAAEHPGQAGGRWRIHPYSLVRSGLQVSRSLIGERVAMDASNANGVSQQPCARVPAPSSGGAVGRDRPEAARPPVRRAAAGEAGGFNAVRKLLTKESTIDDQILLRGVQR
jgi:hypothetical protein